MDCRADFVGSQWRFLGICWILSEFKGKNALRALWILRYAQYDKIWDFTWIYGLPRRFHRLAMTTHPLNPPPQGRGTFSSHFLKKATFKRFFFKKVLILDKMLISVIMSVCQESTNLWRNALNLWILRLFAKGSEWQINTFWKIAFQKNTQKKR